MMDARRQTSAGPRRSGETTMNAYRFGTLLVALALVSAACGRSATPTSPPPPPERPTEPAPATPASAVPAGPVRLTGTFNYTNDIITIYYSEQAVSLADMHGFVTRDLEWEFPIEGQVLGYLKLDSEKKEGTYFIDLPARPAGTLNDVDNDGQTDVGVQVFAAAYWPNLIGSPYSEGDDRSRGWPSYLASVKTDSENKDEVIGGRLLVWAPDGEQQFPTGFGDDGLLFTGDDPAGPIPSGYSVVDLDQAPFAVSNQEAEPEFTLFEPKDAAIKDYSGLRYTEAFEELFKSVSTNWAFNGVEAKAVDWDALYAAIQPRVAEAEGSDDALAFYQALHDFVLSIPDGHTGIGDSSNLGNQDFAAKTSGGYGFALRELNDGRVIVTFVTPGGPAQKAGLQVGAEVTAWNGEPIADAIQKVDPYSGPFSLESSRRYQQTRYLLRTTLGVETAVTFANPGRPPETATLTSVDERESFLRTSIYYDAPVTTYPVEFEVLDSGIGYIRINSNFDDLGLIIRQFEYALKTFEQGGVANVIIDMRYNGGGAPLGLAGFFHDQEILLGQLEYFSETTGQFEPEGLPDRVFPNQAQYAFDKIAVLVGPACASACELEAYGFSQVPGAIVVGMYPSAGVEAEVARGQYELPDGISIQIPTGRFVNPDGSLFLEGQGVVPTVKVPISEANLLSTEDVVLRAAEDALLGVGAGDLPLDGGPTVGSPSAARSALDSQARFLEDLAPERYDSAELSQAGQTYVYTLSLEKDERLIWMNGWCAADQAALQDNFENIRLDFVVNGTPLAEDQLALFEGPSGDTYCKLYYTVLFRWPQGETTLVNNVTFTQTINDGQTDYPAGKHVYTYSVTRP
jgi:C-terminal processing protease CtpA/Prc